MSITLSEFAAGVDFKVTTLGVDAYLSVMRLGLLLGISRTGAPGTLLTTEEFTFFKSFDPNNRPALTEVLESWVEDCKRAALEKFYSRLTTASVVPTPASQETPAEEAPKQKKSRANLKAVAPITEEPQTPEVKEPEVKVEPQAAPAVAVEQVEVVSTPVAQPESVVKYDAKDKEAARWLQAKLDALDPNWKRDPKAIEHAKAIVKTIDGVQITHIDGKESQEFLSTLAMVWSKRDLSLWTK
jgi:hypothetical protein